MSLNKTGSVYRCLASVVSPRGVSPVPVSFPRTTALGTDVHPTPQFLLPLHGGKQFSSTVLAKFHATTMSEGDGTNMELSYNDIVEAKENNNVLIIDVREQSEIDETGKLPGSIHVPMGDVANSLTNLSEKDFKEKYDKEKPSKDTKIILSCRSGRRSAIVQETIQKLGYHNSYNYTGGWLDWEKNEKA